MGEETTKQDAVWPPFWRSGVMPGESVLFVREGGSDHATATLLFPADDIMELRTADGVAGFETGRDYQLLPDRHTLMRPEGSRIPFRNAAELFPPKGWPHSIGHKTGDPETFLLWSEGSFFHDQQVNVTYRHPAPWDGWCPSGPSPLLARSRALLAERKPLTLAVSGDSISAGYNASGMIAAAPFMPAYPGLVAARLEQSTGSKITLVNRAVGGWNSGHGVEDLPELLESKPDLVLLAYGMNDVGQRDPARYRNNLVIMIERIRATPNQPDIILVASMLGNPQWAATPSESFPAYRDILASFEQPGIALADVTRLWQELLLFKRYTDMTGNGVNHPNDWGHRLYAQVMLSLLMPAG